MKTILLVVISLTTLFFTSCTEESVLQTDPISSYQITGDESVVMNRQQDNQVPHESYLETRDSLIQVQVAGTTIQSSTDEFIVDFTSSFDFTNAQLETSHELDFEDAQGNSVTLSFFLNHSSSQSATLQVTYDLEERNLTELALKETQMIIVQDIIIN